MLRALRRRSGPQTRIELYETVLSGTEEALVQRRVDLAIGSQVPAGIRRRSADAGAFHRRGAPGASAAPARAGAHAAGSAPAPPAGDSRFRQPAQPQRAAGSGAEQRWTFSHKATSIHAAVSGLGFAWFAEDTIRARTGAGAAQAPAAARGRRALAPLYLIYADRDQTGRGSCGWRKSSARGSAMPAAAPWRRTQRICRLVPMSTEGRRRASTTYISGPRPRFNALEPFIIRYLEYLVDKRIAPIAPAVGASKQRKREAPRGRVVAPAGAGRGARRWSAMRPSGTIC